MNRGALAALALAAAACSPEDDLVPPDWDLNRMIRQPRYDPFGTSDFFPDHRAMREPPDGTRPADAPTGPLATGVTGGAPLAVLPVPLTPELLARGRDHFERTCAACHGVAGDGRSGVARAMPLVKPPSLISAAIAARPPGYVFQVITEGFGMMPRYGYQLPAEERWAVVAYLQALQLAAAADLSALPPEIRAAALRELR